MSIPPSRFASRREQAIKAAGKANAKALLITHPTNVSYLTGFSGEDSYLYLTPQTAVLLSDSRFTIQLEEECPGLEVYIRKVGQKMSAAVAEAIDATKVKHVGIEKDHVTLALMETLQKAAPDAEFVPLAGVVEDLRIIKDKDEIKEIREAICWAEKALAMFRAMLKAGQTEKHLHDAMETFARHAGGTKTSFPTIVGVGPRGALPHAVPTDAVWTEDDFVLVDWGVKGKFYCSDLTRVLVGRKITGKFEKVYEAVRAAQQAGIEAIRPGATGGEVDAAARAVITKAGFGPQFSHSLGHGLGMDVHENPGLRPNGDTVLKPGMVVTVEPGIYLPGWGGVRLEDDILVTKDGHEKLSSLSTALADMTLS